MLENYGGTPSTEKGLVILVESYNNLNMRQLAFDSARVLKKNYPEYNIEERNRKIVVSKIKENTVRVDVKANDQDKNWYDIFNFFD